MAKKRKRKAARIITRKAPTGLKLTAIFHWVMAGVFLISTFLLIVGSALIEQIISKYLPAYEPFSALGATFLALSAVLSALLTLLYFYVGKGLWDCRHWARITAIVLAFIGVLVSLVPPQLLSLVISILIIWYLGFRKGAGKPFI